MTSNLRPSAQGSFPSGHIIQMDRTGGTPLWMQVKQWLTNMIRTEGLSEHDRLPSEAELCASFQVSRTVIREALAQMVNEGLIYRLQGKGAFVRSRREEQTFVGSTVGFSGELAEKSQSVERMVLRQEVILPTARMQRLLQIGPEEPVVVIDRVLSVEDIPRAIVRWAMLERVVPGLDTQPLHNRSLYDTIARQYGIRLVRAERWIEAVSLSAVDADLLGVEPGHAALCVESAGSSATQEAIEYYTAHYLTDRSRLRFSVTDQR
ncbi:MAG: GntR family transcriptional regulator [Marivita sp.]|uniref:GntR family transcriptional regulator n=1 Tax=Marivita sp. TaxID=2003365 RepID=UPI0025C14498|nr:GntR family transcriptional regulator [Marivita sp.]MCI5110601.1 GntR family transcriptional regulator [Marivita sp.]